ncbi:hypothetical protein KBD08_03275 [Candidatus Babeliales bacterium]|nr:hypothetical protein [Candidatus Babeliales bacterium]
MKNNILFLFALSACSITMPSSSKTKVSNLHEKEQSQAKQQADLDNRIKSLENSLHGQINNLAQLRSGSVTVENFPTIKPWTEEVQKKQALKTAHEKIKILQRLYDSVRAEIEIIEEIESRVQ